MRRLVIAAAVGTAVLGFAVPSLAQPSAPRQTAPIGVVYSTDGGVFVGVTIDGRPGVGASVADGRACVGVSLQVPQCATIPPLTVTAIPHDISVAGAYVDVNTNGGIGVSTGLRGQPLVSASVANGWACIGFSYEIPFCYPLSSTSRAVAGI